MLQSKEDQTIADPSLYVINLYIFILKDRSMDRWK